MRDTILLPPVTYMWLWLHKHKGKLIIPFVGPDMWRIK